MTKYYAAYDADTIYAISHDWQRSIELAAQNTGLSVRSFESSEISEDLFNKIERGGWYGRIQSFDIRDGMLVETTDE